MESPFTSQHHIMTSGSGNDSSTSSPSTDGLNPETPESFGITSMVVIGCVVGLSVILLLMDFVCLYRYYGRRESMLQKARLNREAAEKRSIRSVPSLRYHNPYVGKLAGLPSYRAKKALAEAKLNISKHSDAAELPTSSEAEGKNQCEAGTELWPIPPPDVIIEETYSRVNSDTATGRFSVDHYHVPNCGPSINPGFIGDDDADDGTLGVTSFIGDDSSCSYNEDGPFSSPVTGTASHSVSLDGRHYYSIPFATERDHTISGARTASVS